MRGTNTVRDRIDLRSLNILGSCLLRNGVEVEVRLVHGFFVVAEADLEEVDLIAGVDGFLGRHVDGSGLDMLRCNEV